MPVSGQLLTFSFLSDGVRNLAFFRKKRYTVFRNTNLVFMRSERKEP